VDGRSSRRRKSKNTGAIGAIGKEVVVVMRFSGQVVFLTRSFGDELLPIMIQHVAEKFTTSFIITRNQSAGFGIRSFKNLAQNMLSSFLTSMILFVKNDTIVYPWMHQDMAMVGTYYTNGKVFGLHRVEPGHV